MKNWNLRIAIVVFAASLAGVIGCESTITSPPGGQQPRLEIIPLALGNHWEYRTRIYGYEEPYSESFDSLAVDSAFMWNGRLWFGRQGAGGFASNDSLGYWGLTIDEENGAKTSELVYPYPVQVGDTIVWQPDTVKVTVTAVGQRVTTPAGTFSGCIRYDIENSPGVTSYFMIKPGLGFIMSQFNNPVTFPPVSETSVLMSYHVEE